MTHYTAADLAMADRHIQEGEVHILEQEKRLTALEVQGLPTEEAGSLLRLLNETQVEHRNHREAIARALDEAELPNDRLCAGKRGSLMPPTNGCFREDCR